MDREGIKDILREVLGPSVPLEDRGEWVSTNCPFAAWYHTHGTDRRVSFGIKENQYNQSVYNCYSCKKKGTIYSLLKDLSDLTGEDYNYLLDELGDNEMLNARLPDWENRKIYDSKDEKLGPGVSEEFLEIYDLAIGHPYLKKRGVSDETALSLGLRVDPDDKGVERILFPVYSYDRNFYGCTSRAVVPGIEPRVRDYFGLPKRHLLLGVHKLYNSSARYVILVEGLFDFARLYDFGFPVVACMHSGITSAQARVLTDLSLPTFVFFDNDEAGRKGQQEVKKQLGDHISLRKVRYPTAKSLRNKRTKERRVPKDPAELSKQQVKHMIADCRIL